MAELLVGQALNEMFRCLFQMSSDYAKIARNGEKLKGKHIINETIKEILDIEEKEVAPETSETESTVAES